MSRKSVGTNLGKRVKAAKSKASVAEYNVSEAPEPATLHRIERGTAALPCLKVIFPLKGGGQHEIDLGFAKPFRFLAEPIAQAFLTWGRSLEPGTRMETANQLRRGFFRFLETHDTNVALTDLDEALMSSFIKWLDSRNTYSKGKVTHPKTRSQILSSLRKLLWSLVGHPVWSRDAAKALELFPERQYLLADKKSVPRQRLSREHLEAIDAAAQRDVAEISARIEQGARLLEEGRNAIESGSHDFSNLAVHLAEITRRYPNTLPNYKQLKAEAPDLYEWAYRSNKGNSGFGMVLLGSYLYASPRDLVPFVLLLAIEGAFNAEALLDMDLSEIAVVERMGVPAVRVCPTKRRAKNSPVKYLDPKWVLPWFDALNHLTKRLRPLLSPAEKEKLFVYAQKWGEARSPRTFGGALRREGPNSWAQALRTFIRDHKLKPFVLSQIRPTEADEVGQAHGSLVASQAMNHVSFNTTEVSYLSSGTRSREAEQLSLIVDQMRRWVDSKGAIDTRRSSRTGSMDRGSATPGYHCAEPYDSPRPGQRKDRLCGAYGECPSCPLASADHDDPVSVAYYVALKDAILRGQENMSAQAWMAKWAPVLVDIKGQIAHIPKKVLLESQRFKVSLPAVG